MPTRICREPGCPEIIDARTYRGLCDDHRASHDRARGTKTRRGYGATPHDTPLGRMTYNQARKAYTSRLASGIAHVCACGCGHLVNPNDWHLGHDDTRTRLLGPMIPGHNLSDAGRAAHGLPPKAKAKA